MQITRQADYAIRAILYLAQLGPDEKASTSQIAEEKDIPLSFLAKIIAQLSVAGLLQTMRGARGGVTLARPAKDINLLEVVEAIDGPIQINECVNDSYQCSQHGCPMRGIWQDTQADLVNRLRNSTFDKFVTE
ncbi:MAG TPA: Rrf2 family transcriptional regulator [Anaerolineales bacterium]|jgi:Rrf2 family protein|nr:Rrf2 family transcriptional regulator [Anaerolineales bacterium]